MSYFFKRNDKQKMSSNFSIVSQTTKHFCVSLRLPGIHWFSKSCLNKKSPEETLKNRETEKELDNLNHKIVSIG